MSHRIHTPGSSMAAYPSAPATHPMVLKAILLGPLFGFIASIWMVRPLGLGDVFSLNLMAPALFLTGVTLIRVPRAFVINRLRQVGFEFVLLTIIVVFSFLSMMNAESPIRAFRVIYPAVLPMTVFLQMVVIAYVEPRYLQLVPRFMIGGALIFSVMPFLGSMVVGPLRSYLFETYRMQGFFENSIQHTIALGTIIPLALVEFTLAKGTVRKGIWGALLLILFYTTFQAGSKAALGISTILSTLLYLLLAFRSRNFLRIGVVLIGVVLAVSFMWTFGLTLAERFNPVIGEKMRSIIEGGVSNYHSIESRQELWRQATAEGKRHWLIGTGAGEKVLGISHAHNLVIDYFKGIGIFGALSIALLCLTIIFRAIFKGLWALRGLGTDADVRILGCYVAAVIYVICNQLSDCFGPSTVGFLWATYMAGRLSEGLNPPGPMQSQTRLQTRLQTRFR